MNVKNIKPWLSLLLMTLIVESAGAKLGVLMTKVECQNFAPDLIHNLSCYANRTSRSTGAFSGEFSITKDLNELKGHYVLSVKRGSSMHEYLSVKMDYCQAWGNLQSNYLLNIFVAEIRKVSNFPLECPLKMNNLYYVREFKLNSKIFPSYLPEMDFISDTQIDQKNNKLLKIIVHGSLVRN